MVIKNANLKWYVLYFDFNNGLGKTNIFYSDFSVWIAKEVKKAKVTKLEQLKEILKREFMYRYWCKSEFEMLVSDLSGRNEEKIDIWNQIEINLDLITKYVNDTMKMGLK